MEVFYIVNESSRFCGRIKLDETKQKLFRSEKAAGMYIKRRAKDWENRGYAIDHMGRETWVRDRVNTVVAKIHYNKVAIED